MKRAIYLIVLVMLTVATVVPQLAIAQDVREKWEYSDGMFVDEGAGNWRQTDKAGGYAELRFIRQTDSYIELEEKNGRYLARLYKNEYRKKKKGDPEFTLRYKGGWK